MIGEFFVERFVQKEDRFGIKTRELGEGWINGFGQCQQVIKEQEVNKIPYHVVEKGERKFYNYGAPKPKLQEQINELRNDIAAMRVAITELQNEIRKD